MADVFEELGSPDPEVRASAYNERGIGLAEAGNHDAALVHLKEAERIAREAGIDELVVAALINQGFAHTTHGDREASTRLYAEAADMARQIGDTEKLKMALANLDVEYKASGQHAEAIAALSEYIDLLGEEDTDARARAFMSRGLSFVDTGAFEEAYKDLEDAGDAAAENGDDTLICLVATNHGYAYSRNEDPNAALFYYQKAVDLARTLESNEYLPNALMNLAQVNAITGILAVADEQFAELEDMYKDAERSNMLADILHWRGAVHRAMGQRQEAVEEWRAEELIRRELGQELNLADCLLSQAEVLRRRGERDAANPLFEEAAEIYERLGVTDVLVGTLDEYSLSLWAGNQSAEALERIDKALGLVTRETDAEVKIELMARRALCLADTGDFDTANDVLDSAEGLARKIESQRLTIWMLARRAYVFAREGRPAEEVTEQFDQASEYALKHAEKDNFEAALREVTSHIVARFGDKYREPVETRRDQLIDAWKLPEM